MKHVRSPSNVERHEQAFFVRQFIVAATGLLYWTMAAKPGAPTSPFIPIVLAVVLNVVYYVLAARRVFYPQVKWIQIPVDLALWTWLIQLTGGPGSLFYPLYAFEIMLAALTLSVAGCAYASVLSILLYSFVAYSWPGPFAFSAIAPRLAMFAGAGAVFALLIRKLATNERLVRLLNEQLRHKVHITTTEEDAVLDGMSCGLVGIDTDSKVTMFNRRAEEITGLREAEVLGQSCADILGSENPDCGSVVETLEDGRPSPETEVDVTINGRAKRLALSCFALPQGFPTRSVCVFQDKTDVRELERRTIRAETLSGLGAMAATLAHELRTPLTAIGGFAAVLHDRLVERPKDAEIADKIERGVKSLEIVTRQLLGFTETPELSRTDIKLSEVVEATMEMLPETAKASVRLYVNGKDEAISVLGDPIQLRQAFLNVILNACEAAPDDGEIRVTLRRHGDEAQLEVVDNGPGVPEDLSTRIFLPFFTTKKGGTGLGLAFSEKLIRAHGGQLTLDTVAGEGAVFTARLPLSNGQQPDASRSETIAAGVGGEAI